MIKKEIIELFNVFESLKHIKDVDFMYLIIKNKQKIKDEIEAIRKISIPSEYYMNYNNEKTELIEKYCEKDEYENIINNNGVFKLIKDKTKEAKIAFQFLDDKYKNTIEENKKQQEKVEKILNEEIEIDFIKIDLDVIPKNEVTGEQLEILMKIIKD
jgi:predicted DNA binding protein